MDCAPPQPAAGPQREGRGGDSGAGACRCLARIASVGRTGTESCPMRAGDGSVLIAASQKTAPVRAGVCVPCCGSLQTAR
jgi:hypothetical protein